jgi:hypothetical protein
MKLLIPAACIAVAAGALAAPPAAGRVGPRRIINVPQAEEAPRQCPEALRGVSLALRPIPGGVALEFTSPRRLQVPELREQLREAAFAIGQYSRAQLRVVRATDGDAAEAPSIPPLEISVTDVGAGARVLIRPQRARDLPELVGLARTFELLWSRTDCNEDIYVRARPRLPYQQA